MYFNYFKYLHVSLKKTFLQKKNDIFVKCDKKKNEGLDFQNYISNPSNQITRYFLVDIFLTQD